MTTGAMGCGMATPQISAAVTGGGVTAAPSGGSSPLANIKIDSLGTAYEALTSIMDMLKSGRVTFDGAATGATSGAAALSGGAAAPASNALAPSTIAALAAPMVPAPAAAAPAAAAAPQAAIKGTTTGHIVSATSTQLVMKLADGTTQTLTIRPENQGAVNPTHLANNHVAAKAPDIKMPSETIDGVTYAVGPYAHAG